MYYGIFFAFLCYCAEGNNNLSIVVLTQNNLCSIIPNTNSITLTKKKDFLNR